MHDKIRSLHENKAFELVELFCLKNKWPYYSNLLQRKVQEKHIWIELGTETMKFSRDDVSILLLYEDEKLIFRSNITRISLLKK
ncbi:hypothetical protein AKJ16_DCAP14765 [Drosera capensis]